jgi:hypothetical protein
MASVTGGDKFRGIIEKLAANLMRGREVKIGFFEGGGVMGGGYPGGMTATQVAILNEFGTGTQPPRPFFRNMITEKSPEWPALLRRQLIKNEFDVELTLNQLGAHIAGQVQEAIRNYDAGPPLAESTIRKKGSDKQLMETGTMWGAVTWVVE